MKKYLFPFLLLLMACSLLLAQRLIADWATLAIGASQNCITIDDHGNIYTVNFGNNTFSEITPDGALTKILATQATDASPYDIVIDAAGNAEPWAEPSVVSIVVNHKDLIHV